MFKQIAHKLKRKKKTVKRRDPAEVYKETADEQRLCKICFAPLNKTNPIKYCGFCWQTLSMYQHLTRDGR